MRLAQIATFLAGRGNVGESTNGHARRARLVVEYNNTDISEDISRYLLGVSYTDNMDGEADDLQIELEDVDGLWRGEWLPERGATLTVSIVYEYWDSPTASPVVADLGAFEVDEIEAGGPPSTVTIKAVSVPDSSALRGEERSKSWEKITLKEIAEEKTKAAGLELFYDATENPTLERVEQSEETDIAFLYKLVKDHGAALKVTDKTVAIFDATKYEQEPPSLIIKGPGKKDGEGVVPISYQLKAKTRDVYKECTVDYQNAQKKEHITATFTDPNKEKGKTLKNHDQVHDQAEAERKAKKLLREKNKDEYTASITALGDPAFMAGSTVKLEGFGKFDAVYIVTKVGHSIGGGYTCTLDLRRVLNGY